jgi:2-polyprenyl-3-methyl-5-hydroxy-6-metoxy-1,4-benzoquinol methylase
MRHITKMENGKKEKAMKLLEELCETERQRTCGIDAQMRYQATHAKRFQLTVELCKKIVPDCHARVLDVGPSQLSLLLSQEYCNTSTLGLENVTDTGGHRSLSTPAKQIPHIIFDLNQAQDLTQWPKIDTTFDLIVYAETLEHLVAAPEYSLTFLSTLLTQDGILLVTTPNAAMIMRRLILLLKGKNPYEQIRMLAENPGHIREYTMQELFDIGARCHLKPIFSRYVNFNKNLKLRYRILLNMKPTFGESLIVAFQKQDS